MSRKHWVYLYGACLPRFSWKKRPLNKCNRLVVVIVTLYLNQNRCRQKCSFSCEVSASVGENKSSKGMSVNCSWKCQIIACCYRMSENILLMSLTPWSSYLYCHAELQDRTGAGTDFQQVVSISWHGWPFGHNRPGPKRADCAPFRSGAGSPSNTMARAEAYLRTKWHLNPCSRLSTTDMGRKWRLCPFGWGSWVPV